MTWQAHITHNPEILGGKPVVEGTRLSVDFILSLFANGWSHTQVLENYPNLTIEHIQAVFAYASESMRETTLFGFPSGSD